MSACDAFEIITCIINEKVAVGFFILESGERVLLCMQNCRGPTKLHYACSDMHCPTGMKRNARLPIGVSLHSNFRVISLNLKQHFLSYPCCSPSLSLSLLLLSNHGFCYANSYSLRSSGTCLDVITWKWDWPDPFFRPCLNPQCIFSKECAVLVVIKSKELWGRSCSCLYYYSDVIVVPDGRLLMTSQLSMQMDFLTALHTLCPRCSASSKTNF